MEASTSTEFQWDFREIDVKEICSFKILEYLKSRCLKYYWALLYHDGSVECEIIDENGERFSYYHLFIWFKKQPEKEKRKLYFSNLPFMQYVRRIYACKCEIVYPSVFQYDDVIPRLVSLMKSKHRLIKEESNIPYWVEDELTKHL